MLLDIAIDTIMYAVGFACGGAYVIHRYTKDDVKPTNPKSRWDQTEDQFGAIPFSFNIDWSDGKQNISGYRCSKCKVVDPRRSNPLKICECQEYPKEHFHYDCAAYQKKIIMRTADDKDDVK